MNIMNLIKAFLFSLLAVVIAGFLAFIIAFVLPMAASIICIAAIFLFLVYCVSQLLE